MANRKRNRQVNIRFSKEEYDLFEEHMKQMKISKSVYLRNLALGIVLKPVPKEELIEILGQIRRVGNNINQIATVANKTGNIDAVFYKENYSFLLEEITKVKNLLQEPIFIKEDICL